MKCLNLHPGCPGTAGVHTQHRAQPHGEFSTCTQEHPKPHSTPVPFSTPEGPAAAWGAKSQPQPCGFHHSGKPQHTQPE